MDLWENLEVQKLCFVQVFPTDLMSWIIVTFVFPRMAYCSRSNNKRMFQGAGNNQLYQMKLIKQERLGLRPDYWMWKHEDHSEL